MVKSLEHVDVEVGVDALSPAMAEAWDALQAAYITRREAWRVENATGNKYRATVPLVPKSLILKPDHIWTAIVGRINERAGSYSGEDACCTENRHYDRLKMDVEFLTDHGIRYLVACGAMKKSTGERLAALSHKHRLQMEEHYLASGFREARVKARAAEKAVRRSSPHRCSHARRRARRPRSDCRGEPAPQRREVHRTLYARRREGRRRPEGARDRQSSARPRAEARYPRSRPCIRMISNARALYDPGYLICPATAGHV